jgi:hypothetical protein
LFYKFWHIDCAYLLKYLLVYLVKHPNFDLLHSISFFSRIVVDEFIAKGEEIVIKLVELLLIGW